MIKLVNVLMRLLATKSSARRSIRSGIIFVNGSKETDPSRMVSIGDEVCLITSHQKITFIVNEEDKRE